MSADASGSAAILERTDRYIAQTYARSRVAFVRGRGAELWDADGKRYLDFFSSILCTNLGHAHPAVTRAICEQADRLVHLSNLHYSEPQSRLAEKLVEHSFAERVFLCNSGTEANEAALKAARRYGHARGGRYEVLTTLGSFHGRTMAMIAATGQEKVRRGFEPMLPGFRYVPYGDVAAMEEAIRPETVAILVEPIQGEGGVVVPPDRYLPGLRELCDRHDMLLMFDEVQTGCGRTGTLFAYEQTGCAPDVMTLAKSLGNGLPVGAMLAAPRAASALDVGAHASTFGGNCVTNAAAVATLEVLTDGGTLARARLASERFRTGLASLAARHPEDLGAVRGRGLLLGLETRSGECATGIAARALERGLLLNVTAERVLRIAPPLVVSDAEIDEGLAILGQAAS
ncbi:MAG: aspartate aminotransferase family protein [Deltaproteobacteria bacterium]|nr:aspartate aminotransferase family protein [Deltaproteobacteria bacterium]